MAVPFGMILILYVIPCNLCEFSKLIILYIYMYYSIIFMTNKSVMTFLYVNNISDCLSVAENCGASQVHLF